MYPITVRELIEFASRLGVPAGDLLGLVQQRGRIHIERIGDREERIEGEIPLG